MGPKAKASDPKIPLEAPGILVVNSLQERLERMRQPPRSGNSVQDFQPKLNNARIEGRIYLTKSPTSNACAWVSKLGRV